MINRVSRSQVLCAFAVLFALFTVAKAQNPLPLIPKFQANSNECWAAGCQMVLDYYYPAIFHWQTDIVAFGTQGMNIGNYLYSGASKGT